jgi:hypothetical protein
LDHGEPIGGEEAKPGFDRVEPVAVGEALDIEWIQFVDVVDRVEFGPEEDFGEFGEFFGGGKFQGATKFIVGGAVVEGAIVHGRQSCWCNGMVQLAFILAKICGS